MTETTDQKAEQLRQLTRAAIDAAAGLAPFVLGTGCDGHGVPLPKSEVTIGAALDRLVEAGRIAQALKEGGSL